MTDLVLSKLRAASLSISISSTSSIPRDLMGAVEDHDFVVAHQHLDGLLHEPMRNAVANRGDVAEEVVGVGLAACGPDGATCASSAPRK